MGVGVLVGVSTSTSLSVDLVKLVKLLGPAGPVGPVTHK